MEIKKNFKDDLEELKLKKNKIVAIGKKLTRLIILMEDMLE